MEVLLGWLQNALLTPIKRLLCYNVSEYEIFRPFSPGFTAASKSFLCSQHLLSLPFHPSSWDRRGKNWAKNFINVDPDPDPDLIPDFSRFFHVWLLAISLIFQLGVAVYKKILKEQQVLQFCQNSSPRERFTGLVREYREAAERHCPHWLQQRLLHRLHPCLHDFLQHMAKLQADRGTGES